MPFFKKKEKDLGLPELPPLPPLPPVPELPEKKGAQKPSFPSLPKIEPSKKLAPIAPLKSEEVSEKAKVFVRIDKYKDIMKTIDNMQHKIIELQKTLDKISSIKTREAEIISGWNALLAEAKSKIDEVTHKLTKPEA